jgi:hypothetical protein
MERVIVVLAILGAVFILAYSLQIFNLVAEPFVVSAEKPLKSIVNPETMNPTGVVSEISNQKTGQGGFFYCREENAPYDAMMENLPTCGQLRADMMERFRNDGVVPALPPGASCGSGGGESEGEEFVGPVSDLKVVLNRCAPREQWAYCYPQVNCSYFVNPQTRRLYCPIGMKHITDSAGNHTGCYSFGNSDITLAYRFADTVNPLQAIQTVGSGFRLYPPQSAIIQALQKSNPGDFAKIIQEKSNVIMMILFSYPSFAEKYGGGSGGAKLTPAQTYFRELVKQFMDGVMNSYLIYQSVGGGQARVGYYRIPGVYVPNLGEVLPGGPMFDVTDVPVIPYTMTASVLPVVKPLPEHQAKSGMTLPRHQMEERIETKTIDRTSCR